MTSREAKVKEILNGNSWKWLAANSNVLCEIKGALMNNPRDGLDSIVQLPSTNNQFSTKLSWNEFKIKKREVK